MTGFVVSHMHWDRAWYLPFQRFRFHLVRTVEEVLELLEGDPEFRAFLLDGQTVVLDDVFEVRPALRARVQRLVRAGRLQIGPWFTLPDEFLVSGEALIRNLLCGLRRADELGGPMRVGYVPDSFGHVSQLPQILRGFGIDSFVFMRGMPADAAERLGREFWWDAPDGSRVLAIYLRDGYYGLSGLGHPVPAGHPAPFGDFVGRPPDLELAVAQLREALARSRAGARTDALLMMNGMDHMPAQRELPALLAAASRALGDDVELRHASLPEYVAAVRAAGAELPVWRGELAGNAHHPVLAGVHSARVYLKQANERVLRLLERHAEPLVACLGAGGASYASALEMAWRHALLAHPHDNVCGTSVDAVHDDDLYHLRQAEQIADAVIDDVATRLAHAAGAAQRTGGCWLLVHNGLGRPVRRLVQAHAFFPAVDRTPAAVRVEYPDGSVADAQMLGGEANAVEPRFLENPRGSTATVAFELEVPACGYALVRLIAADASPHVDSKPDDDSRGSAPADADAEIGNDHLRLLCSPTGVVSLERRHNGSVVPELFRLEDAGDDGDVYSYSLPREDPAREIRFLHARVLAQGPQLEALRLEYELIAPMSIGDAARVASPLSVELSLAAQSDEVGVRVHVHNHASDHRLRMLFPAGRRHQRSWAGGHFAVEERARRSADAADTEWPESGERAYPTQFSRDFVLLRSEDASLLVTHRGLHEYELVERDEETCLAITLLRAVGRLSRTGGTIRRVQAGPELDVPGAQCLGPHVFELSVRHGPADLQPEAAGALAEEFVAGPLVRAVALHPHLRSDATLPRVQSMVQVRPEEVALSSLRVREDGSTIARVWNRAAEPRHPTLRLATPVENAELCDLAERRLALLEAANGMIELELGPHEIVTVRLSGP